MDDVINLSSDDDDQVPPPKRWKYLNDDQVIELSDGELDEPSDSKCTIKLIKDLSNSNGICKETNDYNIKLHVKSTNNSKITKNESNESEQSDDTVELWPPTYLNDLGNFGKFLNICDQATLGLDNGNSLRYRFTDIILLFKKLMKENALGENFNPKLKIWETLAVKSYQDAIIAFNECSTYLNNQVTNKMTSENCEVIEIPDCDIEEETVNLAQDVNEGENIKSEEKDYSGDDKDLENMVESGPSAEFQEFLKLKRISPLKIQRVAVISDVEEESKAVTQNSHTDKNKVCNMKKQNKYNMDTGGQSEEIKSIKENENEDNKNNEVYTENEENDIILISDNSENNNKKGAEDTDSFSEESNVIERDSSSKDILHESKFKMFLDRCLKSTLGTKYDLSFKIPDIIKLFKNLPEERVLSADFKLNLEEFMEMAEKGSREATLGFHKCYTYFKQSSPGSFYFDSKDDVNKLKMLEICIKKLQKKIKKIEEEEVDFSDDENSSYIKLDSYKARLNKVFVKWCSLLKKNPYSGRQMYEKINFQHSNYPEINRTINTKYKNSVKFPSYYEIESCIRECVTKYELPLSDAGIKTESEHVFLKLGDILQSKRRKDMYETHSAYIENTDDPAKKDPELFKVLKENSVIAKRNTEEVWRKVPLKQEMLQDKPEAEAEAISADSSSDSDNSHYVDSEDDT